MKFENRLDVSHFGLCSILFSGSRCQARDLKDLDRTESEIQFLKKQCQAVKITILAVRKSALLS